MAGESNEPRGTALGASYEGIHRMPNMLSKQDAVAVATRDAAARLGVAERDVVLDGAEDASYPNAALGAARPGEMSFDVETSGWTIRLAAGVKRLEYRANGRQVRLVHFEGANHLVYPA